MSDNGDLTKLVNASGYAFQLSIEEQIATNSNLGFQVAAREHPWRHAESVKDGFIDLVVEKHQVRIVVECKRTRDANWAFLVPKTEQMMRERFECHWTLQPEPNVKVADWGKTILSPASPESQFCTIRGMGEGQVSALDRIGSELVLATEALARTENEPARSLAGDVLIYLPVVVTNAKLLAVQFDPADMDLSTGLVESAESTEVPLVRYRKALDPNPADNGRSLKTIREFNERSQRSLFVVHSAFVVDFLKQLEFKQTGAGTPWDRFLSKYRK